MVQLRTAHPQSLQKAEDFHSLGSPVGAKRPQMCRLLCPALLPKQNLSAQDKLPNPFPSEIMLMSNYYVRCTDLYHPSAYIQDILSHPIRLVWDRRVGTKNPLSSAYSLQVDS